ncbi:hypothetical protein SDAV_00600 [Spiroplasma phoeniceum P40]|uniref:Uncharacterized protein n=1 Tax=Spiroplasma phoeniceum P40 TaxID=1276259 RepID=A0A345DN03_9MOLU|nr:hypothetical protein SDAV_00600 [Spiroplasma phoeniceum P40]
MNITESIKFNKVKAENEKLKNKLDELKQFQLKKSDITLHYIEPPFRSCFISNKKTTLTRVAFLPLHRTRCLSKLPSSFLIGSFSSLIRTYFTFFNAIVFPPIF